MRVWRDVPTWWVGAVFFWRGNARLGTLTYVGVLSLLTPPATVAAEKQAFPRYSHGSFTVYVCVWLCWAEMAERVLHTCGVDARNYVFTTLLYL
ncbi:hypothetical protein COCC4DRAFT_57097 [Bipolaris maydis ATCC 48331]|uniref:Uncharacterized protein n=1 Tax=Cochliobolus heterostrophus (strain C4 / ATCC 48331 / race T) TaxID=665024 RepID=N4X984_COCH4|nr:uncharacterized protein COCC4DRAFT_57097 [Bipolaris maydis ATCC 48331]ENI09574.1 hypothetical protein COCC4DRAFT_57097 [Bipolaris maydis ATCC 48331]